MLQGLDPVLEGIVHDLETVTDYTALFKMKKELAVKKEKDDEIWEKEAAKRAVEKSEAQMELPVAEEESGSESEGDAGSENESESEGESESESEPE